jgi:thiamine-phosphate pyrophosphorylase
VSRFEPPWLYIITDRRITGGRPLPEVVAEALAGARQAPGRVAVQLREKDLGGRALLDLARALRAVTAAAGAALFVNDRLDVALAAGADGVHLTRGSLVAADVRALAPALAIAASTHHEAEVAAAAAAGVDFVIPVLALGGIDPANARSCIAVGAAGVACIRSVISATNSAARVSSFLACKTSH